MTSCNHKYKEVERHVCGGLKTLAVNMPATIKDLCNLSTAGEPSRLWYGVTTIVDRCIKCGKIQVTEMFGGPVDTIRDPTFGRALTNSTAMLEVTPEE